MSGKRKIRLVLLIAVLLIAIVTVVIIIRNASQETVTVSDTAFVTSVEEIQKQEIWLFGENRFGGVAEAEDKVEVIADTDRTIKETYVKKGDTVKKGDKLFAYDTESTQLELDKTLLEIDELNAEIKSHNTKISTLEKEKAKATEEDERLSIENDLIMEKIALKKAEYNLENDKKETERLKKEMKNNIVTATKGGKIKSVNNISTTQTAGAFSLSGASDNSENVYITITASTNYRIRAVISETYIESFDVGKDIIVRSRTDETITWKGKVHSVGNPLDKTSTGNAETVTKYPVYISLENQDGIKLGQHFTVEIGKIMTTSKDTIELNACYLSDTETSPYVWKAGKNGTLEKCSVTLGKHNEENDIYEITSGITKSDYIAYPEDFLYEGMSVKKTDA